MLFLQGQDVVNANNGHECLQIIAHYEGLTLIISTCKQLSLHSQMSPPLYLFNTRIVQSGQSVVYNTHLCLMKIK